MGSDKDSGEDPPTPQGKGDNEENTGKEKKAAAYRSDGVRHVEKGSLTEAELVKAKIDAKSSKQKDQMTEEERRVERRAANRLSAFQSRQRRKIIIEDLQVCSLCLLLLLPVLVVHKSFIHICRKLSAP